MWASQSLCARQLQGWPVRLPPHTPQPSWELDENKFVCFLTRAHLVGYGFLWDLVRYHGMVRCRWLCAHTQRFKMRCRRKGKGVKRGSDGEGWARLKALSRGSSGSSCNHGPDLPQQRLGLARFLQDSTQPTPAPTHSGLGRRHGTNTRNNTHASTRDSSAQRGKGCARTGQGIPATATA